MKAEHEAIDPTHHPSGPEAAALTAAPGSSVLPRYDDGWVLENGQRAPYLSYVAGDVPVNWSEGLEALHEEASRTHFIDRWTRDAIVRRVGRMTPGGTIVDLGCSTGYLLEDLRKAYPAATLFGIDLVADGLIKAHRGVPGARLLQADACALPLADATVDAVVSANVLEHVPDDVNALREIARVLRPGRHAVIVVPAGPMTYDYYDRFLGHERRYARRELALKCGRVGLEVQADLHIGSLLYPAFWLVKQRNRLLHDGLRGDALQARVAADIARTRRSRVGRLVWRLEDCLVRAGLRVPFGIRSLVVVRRPEVAP